VSWQNEAAGWGGREDETRHPIPGLVYYATMREGVCLRLDLLQADAVAPSPARTAVEHGLCLVPQQSCATVFAPLAVTALHFIPLPGDSAHTPAAASRVSSWHPW
jgi:hypothetical protein